LYILNTVYYIFTKEKVISLNTIEKAIELKDVENSLDNFAKQLFYVLLLEYPIKNQIGMKRL